MIYVSPDYRAKIQPAGLTMPIGLTTDGKDRLVPPPGVQRLAGALERLNRDVLPLHRENAGHSTSCDDAKTMRGWMALAFIGAMSPVWRAQGT